MIDVWGVFFNFLWILGLSVLLATWSYAYYERIGGWNCPTARAQHEGHKTRHILERFGYALALDAGLLLFCAGLAATSRRTWERVVWGVLAAAWVVQAARAGRSGISGRGKMGLCPKRLRETEISLRQRG